MGQYLLKLQLLLGFAWPMDSQENCVLPASEAGRVGLLIEDEFSTATILVDVCEIQIDTIHTIPQHRQQGHASQLLSRICRAADLTQSQLNLKPEPSEHSPVDEKILRVWFHKFGFESSEDFMVRASVI